MAFWLKEFPQQMHDAPMMTFGYNADAAFGRATAEVIDYTQSVQGSLVSKREEPEVHNTPKLISSTISRVNALFDLRIEPRGIAELAMLLSASSISYISNYCGLLRR
jgi:hypothetical protein